MDLIDRYLGAVRRNLPARGADDIVAELRDALANRVEEREAALGRPLTDGEIQALVKDFGHPLVVAARYRRQQWLIGPDVFPFYLMVARILLLAVAGVQVAIGLVRLLFGGDDPIQILLAMAGGLATSLLFSLAIVTFLFVVLERSGFPKEHLQIWNPAQLADVEDERQGPWKSAAEVGFSIAFLLWWTGVFHLPYAAGGPDFRMEPTPVFTELYWPILVLASMRLVHNLIQWLRPRWTLVRAVTGGLTAIGGLVLAALIYRAGQWVTIVSTGMPAGQAAELQTSLNLALKIAIVAVGVIWTFQCLHALWVLSRSRLQAAPA
ncbi:MAG: hypothetical protein JO276_02300 [Sphingomonadaceae bacterium]|nr:hypothetical protein [Sphingomonadaceae bacterium]